MKKIYILLLAVVAMYAISCEPEPYTGPLDSPVGNWDGVRSEYYFNGEMVAALDSCETKAISFYKQGLCCIEGVKGSFPFIYDDSQSLLQIDSTLLEVDQLTGAEMVLTYLYRILPATKSSEEPVTPDDSVTPEEPADPEIPETPTEPSEPENPDDPETPDTPTEPENPDDPETPDTPTEPEEPVVTPDKNGFILPIEYKGMSIDADKYGYYYINEGKVPVYCNFKGWQNPDKTWTVDFWYDSHTDHFIPLVVETNKK